MLLIHAVQKLLNTSKMKASLHVGMPSEGQQLYSWYASVVSAGEPGKMLVLYVHDPSLLVVVCRGKTLQKTFPIFRERLQALLTRYKFPPEFIAREMAMTDAFSVSKTNNRSILGSINDMKYGISFFVHMEEYMTNLEEKLEDNFLDHLHGASYAGGPYKKPMDYWRQQLKEMK